MPAYPSHALSSRPNAMTVDVEEYFHVSAFSNVVSRNQWASLQSRVERSVDTILELFEASHTRATFFMLTWVAVRHPKLVRRIADNGHEVASHGIHHQRVTELAPTEFRTDIRDSKKCLEDITGVPVKGYRAPSFSINHQTPWAHRILAEQGYRYSSSVYPVVHDHYGMPDAPKTPYRPLFDSEFLEVPITSASLRGRSVPAGGGGYFRLLPYSLFKRLLRSVEAEPRQLVFYFHPWELDPQQPRIPNASAKSRFRHYINLSRTKPRLARLLHEFDWSRMDDVFL